MGDRTGNRRLGRWLVGLVALAAAVDVPAQGEPAASSTDTLVIDSAVLKEKRTILVAPPRFAAVSGRRYPVVYLLDGDAHLAQARATVSYLAENLFMPEAIVVGIPNTDRMRDFTPTRAAYLEFGSQRYPAPTSGGAAAFLRFLETEVAPRIEASYPALPFRVLFGHSLGCTFAAYALAARPGLFQGAVLAAPTLTWDGGAVLRSLDAFLKTRAELRATVFVAVPGEDSHPARESSAALITMLERSGVPGLRARSVHLVGDDHDSSPLPALYQGLKAVFEGWKMAADPETGEVRASLAEIRRHYEELSARLGIPAPPPERLVNTLGYEALGRGDHAAAVEFFRFNVAAYPSSPNASDSLGEALERGEALPEALECYRKAITLAERIGHPALAVYRQHADGLAARLASPPTPAARR